MYHNKNVTSPIQLNKYEYCTDISVPHIRVIICMTLIQPCQYLGMSMEYIQYTVPIDVSRGMETVKVGEEDGDHEGGGRGMETMKVGEGNGDGT